MTFAVQFLQNHSEAEPEPVRDYLRQAFDRLPITRLLLAWNLPGAIETVCVEETARHGVRLLRWQPLLSGDGLFKPLPAWQTVGPDGVRIRGYLDDDEFTFVCPNHPEARQAILDYVDGLLASPCYQGLFLDRIRFPSPVAGLSTDLGCFCEHCARLAARDGLALDLVCKDIQSLLSMPDGTRSLLGLLLSDSPRSARDPRLARLSSWLDFRSGSVTRLVAEVAARVHTRGGEVGLDCFSPGLTRLVGQSLPALERHAEWTKVMTYAHTLGPAGLPFEFLALAGWLVKTWGISDDEAVCWLAEASGLPLPAAYSLLEKDGVSPDVVEAETRRGRRLAHKMLFSGLALVDIPGLNRVEPGEVAAEVAACQRGGADGLVISWDLWEMPLERLDQVRSAWG